MRVLAAEENAFAPIEIIQSAVKFSNTELQLKTAPHFVPFETIFIVKIFVTAAMFG